MDATEKIERHPFEQLADKFVSQLRAGLSPSIDQYALDHPEHAATIRSVFPSLVIVEKVSAKDATESLASTNSLPKSPTGQNHPRNFDDFHILRCIGQGGMGVVYEAIQESLQRKVALKVIHPGASVSTQNRNRFRREAESAAGLHHTNIVPVYGSGEDHGLLYYAMQLIHGSTLAQIIETLQSRISTAPSADKTSSEQTIEAVDRLLLAKSPASPIELKSSNSYAPSKDKTLPLETQDLTIPISHCATRPQNETSFEPLPKHYYRNICRLISQVANALDYAHQSGVLHRDIKPSNLLLDHTGTIWVADFGLARRDDLDSQTQTGEVLGTLRYMSPEQLAGKADQRSDIYSLGLTLFELLTLRPGLDAPKRRLLDPSKYSQLEFNANDKLSIPRDLQTIVLKAAALEPEKRYQRARDLQEDLERFLDDRPIQARRESMIESGIRWARRNPAIATLTATLFGLLLAIASILGLWNRQQRLTLEELNRAYTESAKSLIERTKALEQAEAESKRAKHNMEMALEAFSTITENIASRGRSLELQGLDSEEVESIGFAEAVLTQADVELLNSLQTFFDRFAQQNSADLRLDAAIARRRVGEIEHKIGKYDQASTSLKKAIADFTAIRTTDPSLGEPQKVLSEELLARKELIALHARRDQFPKAQEELDAIRSILSAHPDFAQSPQGRFALASALTSLSSGGARLALERSFNDRRRRSLPPFFNRPADFTVEVAPPMALRIQKDLNHNSEAIGLLEELAKQEPNQTQYRLELARNYRDRMRMSRLVGNQQDFEKSLRQATEIFKGLLEKNPKSPVLKYELANLYASSLVHPAFDANRLEEALKLIQEVIDEHPAVPEYQTLYASLLARSAWVQPFAPDPPTERQFERVENGINKLQQSIAIHQGLVDRFPEIPLYGINLLQTKVQLVDYTTQFRRPEKAKQSLAEATTLAEKMLDSGAARQPAIRAILERLRERKIALENRPEPEKP
ncbi:MAG: protein kinase domain-containing protein [Pirellula sp.]